MTTANKFYKIMDAYGLDLAMEQGKAWYPEAWKYCRKQASWYHVTPERVAAMIAVTSPRARWSKNVEATLRLIRERNAPRNSVYRNNNYGILQANAEKGKYVVREKYYSQFVTGPKVTNFYQNIIGNTDLITVDAIMSKAAGYSSSVTPSIRTEVEDGVRTVADVLGMTPRDTQAAIWCAYRRSAA